MFDFVCARFVQWDLPWTCSTLQVLPLARQLSSMARPAETFSMAFVTAPNHETAKYCHSCFYPHETEYVDLKNISVFWCKMTESFTVSCQTVLPQGIQPDSRSLASGLVSGKLAACVNILPGVTSVYEWEGKVLVRPNCFMILNPLRSMRTQKCWWW